MLRFNATTKPTTASVINDTAVVHVLETGVAEEGVTE